MLKKIKKDEILKIVSIKKDNYFRLNYVSPNAYVRKAVLKLKNNITKIPEIDFILNESEIILTSDNESELEQFFQKDWIKIELMLKKD